MPRFLIDKFNENMDALYAKYSAHTPDSNQPFVEIKPNDPNRESTAHDSLSSPDGSVARDFTRIGKFLTSSQGVQFLLTQEMLQASNPFSETRIYDPAVFIGSVQPWLRIQRPLATAAGEGLDGSGNSLVGIVKAFIGGDSADASDASPGSDNTIGSAGRLQRETSIAAQNRVLGQSGPTGLLNLLPSNTISTIAQVAKNIVTTGILGVNQRPELNIAGEYFSILQWSGFVKKAQPNALATAASKLRKGDVGGALSSLISGVETLVTNAVVGTVAANVPLSPPNGRDDPDNTNVMRYFSVNATQDDGYLVDAIDDGQPNVSYLDRLPMLLLDSTPPSDNPVSAALQLSRNNTQASNAVSTAGGLFSTVIGALVGSNTIANAAHVVLGATDPVTGRIISSTSNPWGQNPAEQKMLFGTLSLAARYTNAIAAVGNADSTGVADVAFFQAQLAAQQAKSFSDIKALTQAPSYGVGYVGGLAPGSPIMDDAGVFSSKKYKVASRQYSSDKAAANGQFAILDNTAANGIGEIGDKLKQAIRLQYGDTIDFIFHDFVNQKVVPFRAMLSGFNENIKADYSIEKYIGRPEKNIVYTGMTREVSFEFMTYASTHNELDFIWQKLNYLTGMLSPSTYNDGFAVPPLTMLTIGNVYVDQPGIIMSLSYSVDDTTSWDIDEQMPMGVSISVVYMIIEKNQVSTGNQFYNYGKPRYQSQANAAQTSTIGGQTTPSNIFNS